MSIPDIDPEKLHQLSQDANVQRVRKLPFDDLDPNAPRDKAFRFETNAYERALFKFVGSLRGRGESASDIIRKFAREKALRELGKVR